ncbi:hypothetical protein ILYODFUR_032931 [Ilyodon furcidens]|uniref:Uncharacterized protein n=1 Tax=Ilyodon furcidens TaxID=33524 RepID=A0ABV0UAE5_9TELE
MRDTNDSLVAMTLQSLAVLVPLLGAQVVVGGDRTKVFKRTTPSFTKSADVTPETSPVHIVGSSNSQMVQPSRIPSMFPKPSGTEASVLSHMANLTVTQNKPRVIAPSSDASRKMSLPLNGFHQKERKREEVFLGPEQANRLEGAVDDWPDWNENDVGEAPSADSAILPPLRGSTSSSADQITKALTLKSSNPLKLSSSQSKRTSSWDNDWSQKKDFKSPLEPSVPVPKSAVPLKGNRTGGLGEEFTIKVKKKIEQDPELDLFADMVPDIKLSSALLLSLEERSVHVADKTLEIGSSIDTATLTARFAVANPSEAETDGWGDGDDLNWEDENAW